jgi:hypothetical protein
MKTAIQWFRTVEDPERRRNAINNLRLRRNRGKSARKHLTLSSAFFGSFSWSLSPEGDDYWRSYVSELVRIEQES